MFVARVNKGLTPARGTGGVRSTSPHKAFRPVRLSSSHTAAHASVHTIARSRAHLTHRWRIAAIFFDGAPPRTCERVWFQARGWPCHSPLDSRMARASTQAEQGDHSMIPVRRRSEAPP